MLAIKPKNEPVTKPLPEAKTRLCPDCRSIMSEVDRITENGTTFVWYECTRPGCDGQWLQKINPRMGVAS